MEHAFDFLVIGSGAAGLSYALRVADHGTVAVVTKADALESNTIYAQGGIAAVIAPTDSFDRHVEDTLVAGAGLCSREVVEFVVSEGPECIRELIQLGAEFTQANGSLDLGREGGHSANRIVHAADTTGREVGETLLDRVKTHPNIHLFDGHFALELITEHHLGRVVTRVRPDIHCFGAYVLDVKGERVIRFLAKATLLATGGAGQVYRHTSNPSVATGDGVAMAYRAKARVANMEFIQFHPTTLFHPDADSFLISEAVRGAGGRLSNQAGERFMTRYDERGELAPRDIVARAIDNEMKRRGESFVWLDISHEPADKIRAHFPNIVATCSRYGFDLTSGPVPVVPAAHYICGGVVTDAFGRTSIGGLYAAGEVACTGLHGANRLASNSLLEALVFSRRAAEVSLREVGAFRWNVDVPQWDDSGTEQPSEWVLISHNREELQQVMSDYVGIVRSSLRLERARRRLRLLFDETEDYYQRARVSVDLGELRNLIAVGHMIVRCAEMRRESRGLHFTTDYPVLVEAERRDTII